VPIAAVLVSARKRTATCTFSLVSDAFDFSQ
jgi:hypothetical protein